MRIAVVHCFHAGDVPSGENEVVRAEAAALARAGHDVRLVTASNDELGQGRLGTLRAAATVATGVAGSPGRQLARLDPDVVHVHSLFPFLGTRWLAHSPGPVVATAHSYRMTCANGYLFRDGEVCTLCVEGRPWPGVRHGCYRGSALATLPLAVAARRGAGGDPVVVGARRLLVLSERARTVLAQAGVPDSKMVRDWHFLPDELDPGPGPPDRGPWLFVGRLTPEKGVERLVTSWPAAVPLRIVGDGPRRPAIEAAAAGKAVSILGNLGRARVLDEMRASFGLVFPSLWYETFGLTYMEALAAGTPTLAFPPTVVADAVAADGTGVVAGWDDVAGAVDRAHGCFDDLRGRCRDVFDRHHTEAAFVARRGELYREVAGRDIAGRDIAGPEMKL